MHVKVLARCLSQLDPCLGKEVCVLEEDVEEMKIQLLKTARALSVVLTETYLITL